MQNRNKGAVTIAAPLIVYIQKRICGKEKMTTYDPSHQGFEIKLDHEQKVIRLGSYFYDLKGVLIREATDEDRQKYYCNKYVTFPIVDNDWLVYDGDAITDRYL